ncbi:MAG: hypothetical protein AB7E55_24745 [Pigmentiphaga sp.]
MHRPVLVVPPKELPVPLGEVKQALRVDHDDHDTRLTNEIRAAAAHYEGWGGILGICLAEQTLRQDYDTWGSDMPIPLGPVISVVGVKWRDPGGTLSALPESEYVHWTDAGGRSFLRFPGRASLPAVSGLGAITVEYIAGHPVTDRYSSVPHDIQAAIKLRVQLMFDDAAGAGAVDLERLEADLLRKHRRVGLGFCS